MSKDEFSDFRSPEAASFDKLVDALDRAYHRPWSMMWRSFLQGMMSAFGAALGWILILIISGVIFRALGGINIFKPITQSLQNYLLQTQLKASSSQAQSIYNKIQQDQNNAATTAP